MGHRVLIGLTADARPEARLRALKALAAEGDVVAWLDFAPVRSADVMVHAGDRVEWIAAKSYAAEAHRRVREEYPSFLHDFARRRGLLNLWSWKDHLGVWWMTPISEMSSFRTPLIDILYQLAVIDQVLAERKPERITLLTDDPLLVPAVRQVAQRHGARLEGVIELARRLTVRRRLGQWPSLRRAWFCNRWVLLWVILRLTRVGRFESAVGDPSGRRWALLCTLFPSMWEPGADPDSLSNRSFGDWPKRLEDEGHLAVYGAMTMASPGRILLQSLRLRRLLATNRIVLLESLLPFRTLLACCLGSGWIRAYRRWRRQHPAPTASCNGNEIGPLLLREIDRDLQSPEVAFNLCVAEGVYRLVKRLGSVASVTYPFEYQPLEKAFSAGVRLAGSRAPVVGFQTGLTGKNHLGYRFPSEQVRQNGRQADPTIACLPDVIVVNGSTTLEALRERVGSDRLVLSGPVRLGYLRSLVEEKQQRIASLRERHSLSDAAFPAVIATSIVHDEALAMLELAFRAGKGLEEIVFLVKDHPLYPIPEAVRDVATRHGFGRYRYCTGRPADLLLLSKVALTGCTSVGVEAIALGCMPIVYADSCRYDLGPLRDVEDAAFFFEDLESLRWALRECMSGGEEFQRRRARWPEALKALLDLSGGDPSSRLLASLKGRGALAG